MTRPELINCAAGPISFSDSMILAIKEGRKWITRRLLKFQPPLDSKFNGFVEASEYPGRTGCGIFTNSDGSALYIKPQYENGKNYYIRETWRIDSCIESEDGNYYALLIEYEADKKKEWVHFSEERYFKFRKYATKKGWQSPYFFPKEAARYFIKIKNIRAERLHVITEEDAKAEGAEAMPGYFSGSVAPENGLSYRIGFSILWDAINKKRGYGWAENDWVWRYVFEKVMPE